jgi:ABC-type glycerol-3-phosphate transport system substrate-binding protein
MKKNRWMALLAASGLVLAGCAPAAATEQQATCDPQDTTALDAPRDRAWVLFQVGTPDQAAANVMEAMSDDGENGNLYVIVRADVVEGSDAYNLVIPVDAAQGKLDGVVQTLAEVVGVEDGVSPAVLHVTSSVPLVPHQAYTFITPGEYADYPLPEYCPPGRHPQSPGANPWG